MTHYELLTSEFGSETKPIKAELKRLYPKRTMMDLWTILIEFCELKQIQVDKSRKQRIKLKTQFYDEFNPSTHSKHRHRRDVK